MATRDLLEKRTWPSIDRAFLSTRTGKLGVSIGATVLAFVVMTVASTPPVLVEWLVPGGVLERLAVAPGDSVARFVVAAIVGLVVWGHLVFGKFLVKREIQGLFVIWGVVTVVFFLRHLTPGNPVIALTPPDAGADVRRRLSEQLGLDQPLYVQYYEYILQLAQLDLGRSLQTQRPVWDLILTRLPATIELAIAATVVAVVIAIPLGVISARRRHEPADYAATLFSLLGISTPNFWLGIMLILLVAVQVDVLPVGGRRIGFSGAWGGLVFDGDVGGVVTWFGQLFLPAITLGTFFTALITRLTRSGMLEEIGKAYHTACQAKGIPETLILYKHVLRNTLIPILTVLGLQLGTLIGGAVITEEVFAWPGLGRFLISSIHDRDWIVIQGILIVIGAGFVIINIVVDAMYAYLDPRVELR